MKVLASVKKILLFFLILVLADNAYALRVRDSTTSDTGVHSTAASIQQMNKSQTLGYQNALSQPVGTIIAWSGKGGINADDGFKYLECNGQSFDPARFPELYAALGKATLPNLNGRFLRGTTNTAQVLTEHEDTLKSYQTDIAPHSHTYRFNLAGQVPTLGTGETIYVPTQDMTDSITEHGGVALQRTQVIQSQAQNRTVTGQLHDSDTLHGVYTGGTETAPTHTYVRYFIRAVP